MAYVNVKDWSVDQVTDWLKGLDSIILQYTTSFLNNGVTGHQLLNLRADDLEHLGVKVLGHQEIILEAVEHLRNFHFELDKENLQMLALRLSCASNSLYRELISIDDDSRSLSTQNLSDVHNIITAIKPLVCWLDRAPFLGDKDYIDCKTQLLELGFEMATSAHRGIFSEKPVCTIREICEKITKIGDHIIQEISDPMILQPASLDLATLKKKEQELGFFILPNNHAVHQIAEIKFGSPAHGSSKIEEGDEIVQVNYQTVVGWQRKNVMLLLQDSPPEIVLTLKKRPRHTKVYGQIYMKPYRLPSKKRENHLYSRWNDNVPSPRLLPIHNLPPIKIIREPLIVEPVDIETETELSNSDSEPPDSPSDTNIRMYPLKPRPILQRRNTITGATPTSKRSFPSVEQYWQVWKNQATSTHASSYNIDRATKFEDDSNFLRDKSVSCNLGIELSPRPTTVIGLSQNRSFKNEFKSKKKVIFQDKQQQQQAHKIGDDDKKDQKLTSEQQLSMTTATLQLNLNSNLNEEKSVSVNSLASLNNENIAFIDEGRELTDRSSMITENDIKDVITPLLIKDSSLADVKIYDIIKKFDEQQKLENGAAKPKIFPRSQIKKPPPHVPQKPAKIPPVVPPRSLTTKIRGKLDKSHSTPAYDLSGEETEKSPDETTTPDPKQEPFNEMKYELGIPIVESAPTPTPPIESTTPKIPEIIQVDCDDLPPKPPPRTFGIPDVNKPAYPVDSPKPNLIVGTVERKLDTIQHHSQPQQQKQIFEFPPSGSGKNSSDYMVPKHLDNPPSTPKLYGNQQSEKICKNFEPKLASTPKLKPDIGGESEYMYKNSPNFEMQKSMSDSKISPTNSIVRAMIYSNKTKAGKKKNSSIVARRRKVSVADLNPPDVEGFLYQRLRSKHNQNVHWEKRWFVLLGNCLYGFKAKEDPRAACLIFLSGFTVAVASEVKSRSNAFKVYHTGTVFYFSAEDPETSNCWIEMITAATLHGDSSKLNDSSLYSETDEEEDGDKYKVTQPEKSESLRKFGSLKKFSSKKTSDTNSTSTTNGSTSLDRKWFFNKSSSHSKNSLPVPTAQFRSYRKIKTNESAAPPRSVITGNFTSHIASFAPRSEIPKMLNQGQNISVPNLTVDDNFGKEIEVGSGGGAPIATVAAANINNNNKLQKPKPLNYIHASNPSLCNIGDFHVPSSTRKPLKQCSDNLTGFVTLEELMIKQSEERKLNPYNMAYNLDLIQPDVIYGEVPIKPKEKPLDSPLPPVILSEEKTEPPATPIKKTQSSASDSPKSDQTDSTSSSCFGKRLGSLKKSSNHHHHNNKEEFSNKTSTYPKIGKGFDHKLNRSLPRTHKSRDNYSHYASDRNLSINDLKDPFYEMIYCPETTTDIQFAQNRQLDDRMYLETSKKSHKIKKQNSFTSSSEKKRKASSGSSSGSTNKVGDSSKMKLTPTIQYTPMALPLGHDQKSKPKLAFEMNLDEKSTASKAGKFKQIFSHHKSSSHHHHHDGKKEKTFLGSPKLHRAIFRRHNSSTDTNWSPNTLRPSSISQSTCSLETPPASEPLSVNINPHADYPGLEYPPVFEPETYSLADPQSCTLLRKQGKSN